MTQLTLINININRSFDKYDSNTFFPVFISITNCRAKVKVLKTERIFQVFLVFYKL